jgi:hypothetical protein
VSIPLPRRTPGPDGEGHSTPAAISPAGAISWALNDTLRLLFQPVHGWRWIKLSLLCLFLGGGTPTAALQWSLTALPVDLRLTDLLARARQYVERHPSLIFLTIMLALAVGLCFLYLRSVSRFILVDSLVKREVAPSRSWSALRLLGQSYFSWLVATLAGLGLAISAMILAAFAGLRGTSGPGTGRLIATAFLVLILSLVVVIGVVVALLIMLTDDLVVPLMYANHLPLPVAWGELWRKMRDDSTSFAVYVSFRFVLSVAVSVAVLLFLVPLLVSVFSGAVIVAASVVLAVHLAGFTWVWTVPTIFLALTALVLLIAILVILLSVVGMPGQVFLQSLGLRFIAARSSSLTVLCAASSPEES